MAQGVVQQALVRAAQETVTEAAGSLRFERRPFLLLGAELQRRLLIATVRWISGAKHPPRETKLDALDRALGQQKDATLGGVRFRWQGKTCWVSRESRACGGPVPAGQLWDGRWTVTDAAGEIRALGAAGLRQCPDWRATGLPRQVLEVTPGVWQGDTLIAAPCAGFGEGHATCAPSFHDFLLLH
jgi:tRNA(Ile)-lysidine synthase